MCSYYTALYSKISFERSTNAYTLLAIGANKKEEQKTNIKRTIDVCQNNHRCVGLIDDRLNDGTEVIFYYVNGIKQIFVIT